MNANKKILSEKTGEIPTKRQKTMNSNDNRTALVATETRAPSIHNENAELWGESLQQPPTYLTQDGCSWYIHVKKWLPTPSREAFDAEWDLRPSQRHELQVFGRTVKEKRFSQSWGFSYTYSGSTNEARPLSDESSVLPALIGKINDLVHSKDGKEEDAHKPYNGCLQNWYTPEDRIGLHADDERNLFPEYPIFSLSWGGPRRFLLRRKKARQDPIELWLEDGDLLLMGGTCQGTHKHEVPKVRVTKDPPARNRINWTVRAFRPQTQQED